jgi:hypothetical protein
LVPTQLSDLEQPVEEEINEGDALCRNIKTQKQAIVTWDAAELIVQINAREPWLHSLGETESRRCRTVGETDVFKEAATVSRGSNARLKGRSSRHHNSFNRASSIFSGSRSLC